MRFPLVPRSTLDALVRANEALGANLCSLMSERDYLRRSLDTALDHNRRLERRDAGLSERPREERTNDPIPPSIRELASKFGSTMTQQDQLTRAKRARADGAGWAEIERTMRDALGGE